MSAVNTLKVDLGSRSYDIVTGSGLLANAAKHIGPVLDGKRIAIITDETVAGLHLQALLDGLADLSIEIKTVILPPGEGQKSFGVLQDLLDRLLGWNFGRDDALLAELRERTHKMPEYRMQISPEQGEFMGMLVRMLGAKLAVEVGTFTGYSALCVARALPADGKLIAAVGRVKPSSGL